MTASLVKLKHDTGGGLRSVGSHFNLVQPGQSPGRFGHRFQGDHQDRKNHCKYPFSDHSFLLPVLDFLHNRQKLFDKATLLDNLICRRTSAVGHSTQ
jgi:hypothetical protein